jgi:hypothetical protein
LYDFSLVVAGGIMPQTLISSEPTHLKTRQRFACALRSARLASVELFQAILAIEQFVLEMRSSTQDAQTIPSPFSEGIPTSHAAFDSTPEPVEGQSHRMGSVRSCDQFSQVPDAETDTSSHGGVTREEESARRKL